MSLLARMLEPNSELLGHLLLMLLLLLLPPRPQTERLQGARTIAEGALTGVEAIETASVRSARCEQSDFEGTLSFLRANKDSWCDT